MVISKKYFNICLYNIEGIQTKKENYLRLNDIMMIMIVYIFTMCSEFDKNPENQTMRLLDTPPTHQHFAKNFWQKMHKNTVFCMTCTVFIAYYTEMRLKIGTHVPMSTNEFPRLLGGQR